MKKLLPMFLIAVSFCLISCGNKTTNQTDLNNVTPEVTIESNDNQNLDENNIDENNTVDENNDLSAPDDTPAPEDTVSPVSSTEAE